MLSHVLADNVADRRALVVFEGWTPAVIQGGFFDCSALKMTKYKEK